MPSISARASGNAFSENFEQDLSENMVQVVFVGGAIGALRGVVVGILGRTGWRVRGNRSRVRRRGGERCADLGPGQNRGDLRMGLPVDPDGHPSSACGTGA